MGKTADVIVVGGGVIGSAAAYYSAKAGLKVLLFDGDDIAGGTSSKCDGNVLVCDKMPGYDSNLTKMSQDMFPALVDELDEDIHWTRKGSLLLIESEAELEAAEKLCRELKESGLPVRMMDRKEVVADEPLISDKVIAGMETACDGSMDPMAVAFSMSCTARRRYGLEIHQDTAVTGIKRDSRGHISGVITDRGEFNAPYVVVACGVWTPFLGKMVGLEIPIQPRKGHILISEPTFQVGRRKIMEFGYMMAKFAGSEYKRNVSADMEKYGVALVFEPTHANNFLIGSSREFAGYDISCNIRILRAMAERAVNFFPVMKDIHIIRSYAGLRPFTPDHLPIISATEVPGFYVAAGHEGDGIGLAPLSGKLIQELITDKTTSVDITPLRLDRFSKNSSHDTQ